MHYHCEVYLPDYSRAGLEKQVEAAMEPFRETFTPDFEEKVGGFWDWWVIGGRWGHAGNVTPVKSAENKTCHTLIIDGIAYLTERWNGDCYMPTGFDGKAKAKLAELGITEGFLVTVDYHC